MSENHSSEQSSMKTSSDLHDSYHKLLELENSKIMSSKAMNTPEGKDINSVNDNENITVKLENNNQNLSDLTSSNTENSKEDKSINNNNNNVNNNEKNSKIKTESQSNFITNNVLEPGTIASRSKRRSTKSVNYKEKSEADIPSTITKIEKRSYKSRRGKLSSDSSSPPPSSSSSSLLSSSSSSSKNNLFFDVNDVIPINYQPPIKPGTDFNKSVDFKGAKIDSNEITLTLKNGNTIKKGDCIYMICEPPTEPFYIAQILGFTKKDKTATNRNASNYMFSVCWFYRPRDLNRRITDTRLVYASLHRDNCPLSSFRGFATVKHKSEIEDLESYRKQPDCFFFDKLYDRYMIKMYDMIPTSQLVHLPPNYYKALNKRFAYIFVEVGKADELLSSPKNCEKCLQWCSNSDSITCSGCQKSYHLLCLDPPILTKPKRGFAWYCAACNKELEDKLAENRGKMLESSQPSVIIKNEQRDSRDADESNNNENTNTFNDNDHVKENDNNSNSHEADSSSLRYEQLAKKFLEEDKNISLKKRREMEEWPYRYLGVHAKFEDALDLQDRPYARAASRLGAKYQCTSLTDWFNHKVQYYDTDDSSTNSNNKKLKRYYNRNKKSSTPIHVEEDDEFENKKFPIPDEYKNLKPKQFPGWLQPKPKGYIERGTDETSKLLWKMPDNSTEEVSKMIEKYIKDCAPVAEKLKLATVTTPNFVDAILLILMRHGYKPEECMADVEKLTRDSLKEPTFTPEEVKRFEDSVRIHGSELYPVFKDVGTQTSAMVVRFYYLWKKTKSGHEIWDNFPGRAKNKFKSTKDVGVDLDNPEDDGIYSSTKINKSQVKFKCIYCETNHSPEWFRAPGATMDEKNHICEGLCYRCAKLWRKYAAKWENPIELIKSQEKKGSYANKKKVEYALIREAELVINAREKYKLHPRKISDGLKEYKTIDTDKDYLVSDKPKKKPAKKALSKTASNLNNKSSASSSVVSNSKTISLVDSKTRPKKDKKELSSIKKTNKRSRDVAKEKIIVKAEKPGDEDEENQPKKKRTYKKRQSSDKGLKFVYGKVINDSSKGALKFTTKKKDLGTTEGNVARVIKLKVQLEATRAQFEENAKSKLFNAFLDMKLRERIESLSKEIIALDAGDNTAESSFDSNLISTTPPDNATPSPNINSSLSNKVQILPKDDNYGFHTGKKYIRRRLFLSKTSVPGSGVFETPPIQLPMDAVTPLSTTTVIQNNLRNKFVFQMCDQNGTLPEIDYNTTNSDTQFQSLPNLLPMANCAQHTLPSSNQSKVKLNTITSHSKNKISKESLASSPSSSSSAYSSHSNSLISGYTNQTTTSTLRKKNSPPEYSSGSIKNKEFVNLSSSFKVKMLTPLIDFSDRITKRMLSRYTTKFDIFNPLLSDDFYISPIYQMRPSSKELHILWKQYQTSRKSKGRANKQFQPLYAADKRQCCVCREFGDVTKMLICSNCGLNVHSSCYGIKLNDSIMDKGAGEYNWHCDTCSNDLHPLVSTQYVCLLCNSRESNMDNAIKGDPVSIPDALKRTVEGRWCHITCSLLCNNIKYGSDSLQPVFGAPVTGIKNIFKSCNICLGNGGSVVKCEFCSAKSHVTCGLDFGWKAGFILENIYDLIDGDVVKLLADEKIGKLKAIFYCDKHSQPETEIPKIYSLNDKGIFFGKNEELTLMQLYTTDSRKIIREPNNGILRRKTYDELNYQFGELILTNLNADTDWNMELQEAEHSCTKCGRKTSLLWHSLGENAGELCHICGCNETTKEIGENIGSNDDEDGKYGIGDNEVACNVVGEEMNEGSTNENIDAINEPKKEEAIGITETEKIDNHENTCIEIKQEKEDGIKEFNKDNSEMSNDYGNMIFNEKEHDIFEIPNLDNVNTQKYDYSIYGC